MFGLTLIKTNEYERLTYDKRVLEKDYNFLKNKY